MTNSPQILIYTPSAPSHGRARGYVHNCNVWVLWTDGGPVRNICSRSILRRHCVASEVDSRYAGPRSRYGHALARARELAAEWTAMAAVGCA